MTNLEKLITARLHEYEDYLDGSTDKFRLNCNMCKYMPNYDCAPCPFSSDPKFGCATDLRSELVSIWLKGPKRTKYMRPPKKLVRARYKEILETLKKNGWEYSYDK